MDLIELAFERMGKKGGKKKGAPSNERQRPRLSRSAAEEDPCFELGTPVEVYFNADIEEGKFKAVVDFIYPKDGPDAGFYGVLHEDNQRTEKIHFCASKGQGQGMVSMQDKKFVTPSAESRMTAKRKATAEVKPKLLFGAKASQEDLADLFTHGAKVVIESPVGTPEKESDEVTICFPVASL